MRSIKNRLLLKGRKNKKTIITSPTRCFYDVSFPFARSRQVLLNPMKIHIEGNLQHNRND